MQQAQTLVEIQQSCDPRPLRPEELDEFFVETAQARDPVIGRRDEIRNALGLDDRAKILLAGHGGSGKSTEIVKLSQEIAGEYFVVPFSVAQECNLFHVPIEDVLVVMMERLVAACRDDPALAEGLEEAESTLQEIHRWFSTELDIEEDRLTTGVEAEAGFSASQSWLGKVFGLLATIKTDVRHAGDVLHRVTTQNPHRLSALAERCNALIGAVKQALHPTGRKLLIVVEDLDRINLTDARRIFLEQPAILAELSAAVICTVAIFLLHSPHIAAIQRDFRTVVLPMPRVFQFDGSPCPRGREAIDAIIARRVRDGLILPEAQQLLIEKTGGVLRNVFEALVVAAQAAHSLHRRGDQGEEAVTPANIRYGLNRLKNDYARAITTIDLPAQWDLTPDDLYQRLRRFTDGPLRYLASEPAAMLLLEARAVVVEYNGETWFDLHPLVRELLDQFPE